MIFHRRIEGRPDPFEFNDEDGEVGPLQRSLGTVEVDTEAETIRLLTPDGQILYTATWELWGLQLLVAGGGR